MPVGPERRQGGRGRGSRTRVAIASVTAALACVAAPAAADMRQRPAATPDRTAISPVAQAGTPAARARAISRDQLGDELRGALRSVGRRSGAWVYDTGGDGKLFGRKGAKRRILASNEKLFTTAATLEQFGPEHRFQTALYAKGARKGTDSSVLDGSLVIVGDGDPALGTGSFARRNGLPHTSLSDLAQAVEDAGIRKVKGKVRADATIFDRKRGIPATGFRADTYLSPLSGLSFNSGFGGGGYAKAPEMEAARALKRALKRRGISVRRGVGRGKVSAKRRASEPLATAESPSLAALAKATNEPSNNFFAEMLLKRLGAANGKKGTTKRGAKRSKRFAKSVGSKVRTSDGSGLGRKNKASPKAVGKLLVAMASSGRESSEAFADSLAVAGREGTLSGRMRGTAAEGACYGKTGTLSGVSALSGYCDVDGAPIAFSILMNGVDPGSARNAQDRMAAAIARYDR